jgi:hypothetical protein
MLLVLPFRGGLERVLASCSRNFLPLKYFPKLKEKEQEFAPFHFKVNLDFLYVVSI